MECSYSFKIAFAGHQKPGGAYSNTKECYRIGQWGQKLIKELKPYVSECFMGLNVGSDYIMFKNLSNEWSPNSYMLRLVYAFEGQTDEWPWRTRYELAKLWGGYNKVFTYETFDKGGTLYEKYQNRNIEIVRRGDVLIAFHDGKVIDDAFRTIVYAHQQVKSIYIIDPTQKQCCITDYKTKQIISVPELIKQATTIGKGLVMSRDIPV